jgi:hypothetical protein
MLGGEGGGRGGRGLVGGVGGVDLPLYITVYTHCSKYNRYVTILIFVYEMH